VDDSFLKTQDPTRSLGESIFLMPRGDFRENVFNLTLDYRFARNTILSIGGNNTYSRWFLVGTTQTGKFTNLSSAGTVALSQIIRQRHRISASYSLLKIRELDAPGGLSQASDLLSRPTHSAGLGYRYSKERGLTFEVSGGVMRGGIDSYSVTGQLEKHWSTLLLGVGYVRQISAFRVLVSPLTGVVTPGISETQLASGVLPNNIIQAATFHYREKFGQHLGVELRGLAGRQNFITQGRNINSVTGRFRVYYAVSDRVSIFVGAESYDQNFNDLLGTSLARRRYLGGMMISLAHHVQSPELASTQQGSDQGPEHVRDIASEWPSDWGKE